MFQMKPYNPDYDPMPPAMVLYGQPAFHNRLIAAAHTLGLPVGAEAMRDYFDRIFAELAGFDIFDVRGTTTEFTHPDYPDRPMHTRLMTDEEVEVAALRMMTHELNMPSVYQDLAPEVHERVAKTEAAINARYYARRQLIGRGLLRPSLHTFP